LVVDVDDEVDVVDDGVVVGVVLVEDALVLVVGVLEVGVSEEEEVAVSVGVTVDEEVTTGGAGGRVVVVVVVVVVFVLSESAETNDGEEKGELVEQTRRRHIKMIESAIFAIIFCEK